MVTIHISEKIADSETLHTIEKLILKGLESIEVDIATNTNGELIICLNKTETLNNQTTVYLEDLFRLVSNIDAEIQVILNFKEPNLESRAHYLIEKWDLKRKVKYSGIVTPSNLTVWDRLHIIYNVENSLPNIYQFNRLKPAHLDVISYFCNKYKVKTIRIHAHLLTNEVIEWCKERNLKLSVSGSENLADAKEFKGAGVAQVSTSNI